MTAVFSTTEETNNNKSENTKTSMELILRENDAFFKNCLYWKILVLLFTKWALDILNRWSKTVFMS